MNRRIRGRGAQMNVSNRFHELSHEMREDFLEFCLKEGEQHDNNITQYIQTYPKTIVNKVTSPDVGMSYSLNPYQGCEHGCVYCYARNSHEFWGYSAGLDFERKILVKQNAPKLLEDQLKRKSWQAKTIVLSGNTDCYQPVERRYELTRQCLEVFLKYKHPVGIITKNALVLRDLDFLQELAKYNLILINISITSLNEETRRLLEPRTASTKLRLKTIEQLSKHGIPVNVMLAPIIPSLNSHEVLPIAKTVSHAGALGITHTVVRLNGAIAEMFADWLHKTMPEKASKILNQIANCHGGTLNESRFGIRMRGEGPISQQIYDLVKLARQKYFSDRQLPKLNTTLFQNEKFNQLSLFD